jgi:cytochrome c oxidase subunit I
VNTPSLMRGYSLEIQPGLSRQLARAWLRLGVAALIGSGLLALLLVLSRTPGIQDHFPLKDFFRASLVVHVDLSVMVWFMAFAGVLWSLAGNNSLGAMGWAGYWLAVLGTALITISPFFPDTQPLLNNYIPVLQTPVFFAGLAISAAGYGLTLLRALLTTYPTEFPKAHASSSEGAMRLGIFLSAIAGSLALAGFVISWLSAPTSAPALEGKALFEAVFWGGGHTLQFQHSLLVLIAWFWLASSLNAAPKIEPRIVAGLFIMAALPLIAMPVIYSQWPVGSAWHIAYFARMMEAGHPMMLPLVLIAAFSLLRVLRNGSFAPSPAKAAFIASFLLFATGGILAYMIRGVNVVIPAHYHGSIVGITLAFMGLTYVLLPRLGFSEATGKMARWQPYVYGGGQMMHVLGLAVSGGYGVQRKVAGAEQMLTTLPQKIGMGVMGLGGTVAIVGGIMFVIVCLKSMSKQPMTKNSDQ